MNLSKYKQIENFYEFTANSIIDKYVRGVMSKGQAEIAFETNRWWFHFFRDSIIDQITDPSNIVEVDKTPGNLSLYSTENQCVFIVKYRSNDIPFYHDQDQPNSYYAIIGGKHHCLSDQFGTECLLNILDQIDIGLDEAELLKASDALNNK